MTPSKLAASAVCVLCVVLLIDAAYGQDYCKICLSHTMCKYKGDGSACKPKLAYGVKEEDKKEILKTHNELRRAIAEGKEHGQPPAADMMNLVWDDELATIAQRWADQCIFGHDSCRNVENMKVGQNAMHTGSSKKGDYTPDWKKTVKSWYSEVKDWKTKNIQPFVFIKAAGHFTQVVWSRTEKIGCGFSVYPAKKAMTDKLYICNYGPGGNMKGRALYIKGKACSACPADTYCKDGLCHRNKLNVTTTTPAPTPSVVHLPVYPTSCAPNAAYYEGRCKSVKDICSKYNNVKG